MTATTPRWVIGRGLLGRAISRSRPDAVFGVSVPWHDPDESLRALTDAARDFFAEPGHREVYWCAGRGVTSTPAVQLDAEVDVFERFVRMLSAEVSSERNPLSVFLASSVGGAYAGSVEPPFTESTVPAPASAYGDAKLRMESILRQVVDEEGWRAFIARITNLYGPGQDLGKGQGLISVVVASYVTGRPVSLYVPLDTLRDYIYEDDCARVVDAAMRRVGSTPPGTTTLKIVGAMTAVSIGAILGENGRLRRRRSPIVLGQGNSSGQSSDLRVRSEVWADLDSLVRTTFAEGLDAVYRAQLAQHARGAVA